MTATCQSCSAPSPNAWICKRCQAQLGEMLRDCVWWIDRLAEAAVSDVRMSDGSSRVYATRYPIHGDDHPAHYIACFPADLDDIPDEKALNRRYVAALRQALAAGRVNERASVLMDEVANILGTIVRGLCESRGIEIAPSAALDGRAAAMPYTTARWSALWLRGQLRAICADESAGQIYADIHNLVGDTHEGGGNTHHEGRICKAINRPIPMRFCGNCPTWHEDQRKVCGAELWCRDGDIEVFCKACRQTHNANRQQLLMVNDAEREKMTIKRVLQLNRVIPQEYRIDERKLRRWRSVGPKGEPPKLKTRGYLRPCSCNHKHSEHNRRGECKRCDVCSGFDGREVITRHSEDDEPLYLWADVQKLRVESGKVTA
jgi:hypothetical protein